MNANRILLGSAAGRIGLIVGLVLLVVVVVDIVVPIMLERKKRKTPSAKAQPAPKPVAEKKQAPKPAEKKPTPAPVAKAQSAPVSTVKEQPAPAPVVKEQPASVPTAEALSKENVASAEQKPAATVGKTLSVAFRYNKSFTAKLIQGDEQIKQYYSQVKNHLLSYRGVRSKTSWKWETFRKGRETLAKLYLRGKTLSVCLALNADDYADTKYRVENAGDVKAFEATPCLYRLKNDRRLRYAQELIDAMMAKSDIIKNPKFEATDYISQYPFESTEALVGKKLIKKVATRKSAPAVERPSEPMQSVAAHDVDALMKDEVASTLIVKSDVKSDKTKTAIINIDVLAQCFKRGEMVTLAEIKKRVKGFNKVTYIKVLARGTLDKPLTVEADDFSIQAVKMIALTGGTAVKKK